MSVSMISLSSLSTKAVSRSSAHPGSGRAGVAVDEANRQVLGDQQKVDQRRPEAARRASDAQQAATELKNAKAVMARDQAALSQAKSRATLDVYT